MYRFKTSDSKKVKTSDGKNFFVSYPVDTTITINEGSVIRAVPPDFAGMCIGPGISYDFILLAESNPAIVQLYKNLGQSNMRIECGDFRPWYPDTPYETFPPALPYYYNKSFVDRMCAIFESTGWSITWLLNLIQYNPTMFADMAGYIYSVLGSKLEGFEIGNEPDRYVINGSRDSVWTYSDFLTEWDAYESAIHTINPAIPLCGPECGSNSTWFRDFSIDRKLKITWLNHHRYPTTKDGTSGLAPTIENLLSARLRDETIADVETDVGYAVTASLPFVEGETNAVSGSKDGTSNTFAASLWGIDYMFLCLALGVSRVNFRGSYESNLYYAPILAGGTPGPLYYAELLFHQAAPGGNMVESTTVSSNNVVGYSVVKPDGKLSVVIVNKDVNYSAHVKITPAGTYSMATAIFLTAPAINSKTGITFGGNAVAEDGTWTAETPSTLPIIEGSAFVALPAGSAAVVTLSE